MNSKVGTMIFGALTALAGCTETAPESHSHLVALLEQGASGPTIIAELTSSLDDEDMCARVVATYWLATFFSAGRLEPTVLGPRQQQALDFGNKDPSQATEYLSLALKLCQQLSKENGDGWKRPWRERIGEYRETDVTCERYCAGVFSEAGVIQYEPR